MMTHPEHNLMIEKAGELLYRYLDGNPIIDLGMRAWHRKKD